MIGRCVMTFPTKLKITLRSQFNDDCWLTIMWILMGLICSKINYPCTKLMKMGRMNECECVCKERKRVDRCLHESALLMTNTFPIGPHDGIFNSFLVSLHQQMKERMEISCSFSKSDFAVVSKHH